MKKKKKMSKIKQISLVYEATPDFDELNFIKDMEKIVKNYKGISVSGKHIKLIEKRE